MIKERQLESNPYLKMRGESQAQAKRVFERRAGWRYGLVFGLLVVTLAYALDAWQLSSIRAEFWWIKFALGCVTILPLAILAGGISGYTNWFWKVVVWGIFGLLAGYCAIHIPFEGASMILERFDPNLRVIEFLRIPEGAAGSFGMLATLGALLGILVGLLQTVVVNWAWERSTEDYKLTWQGWLLFLIAAPFAIAFAFLYDGTAHSPIRTPMQLTYALVQSGLNDPPGLDHTQMEIHRALIYLTAQRWRKDFTPEFTTRMAASEPTVAGEAFVDVSFSNGFNWRCRVTTFGEFTGSCYDLNAEYARYVSEFAERGSFRCTDCEMRVERAAEDWRGAHGHALSAADKITARHGAGSSMVVRVAAADGAAFECLLSGANPVIIEECR
jgi:hypothetical protein